MKAFSDLRGEFVKFGAFVEQNRFSDSVNDNFARVAVAQVFFKFLANAWVNFAVNVVGNCF